MTRQQAANTNKADIREVKTSIYLKQKMAQEDLKPAQLAEDLNVHVQTIYNAIKGTRDISPKLAIKLAEIFPEPAEFWLKKNVEVAEHNFAPINDTGHDGYSKPTESAPQSLKGSTILVDYEIEEILKNEEGPIKLAPYSIDSIQPASYDLRVGLIIKKGFRKLPEYTWATMINNEAFREDFDFPDDISPPTERAELEPDESAIIIAKEIVSFSKQYVARVGSIAGNTKIGLLAMHGFQIDPGYRGVIAVRVKNMSEETLILSNGAYDIKEEHPVITRLLSLEICQLHKAPHKAHLQEQRRTINAIARKTANKFMSNFVESILPEDRIEMDWAAMGIAKLIKKDELKDQKVKSELLSRVRSKILNFEGETKTAQDTISLELEAVIKSVYITRREAKALYFKYGERNPAALENTLNQFPTRDAEQTLFKTLTLLDIDEKFPAIADILNHEIQ